MTQLCNGVHNQEMSPDLPSRKGSLSLGTRLVNGLHWRVVMVVTGVCCIKGIWSLTGDVEDRKFDLPLIFTQALISSCTEPRILQMYIS